MVLVLEVGADDLDADGEAVGVRPTGGTVRAGRRADHRVQLIRSTGGAVVPPIDLTVRSCHVRSCRWWKAGRHYNRADQHVVVG